MALKRLAPESVKMLVVHCSATYGPQDIGAKEIDQWHKQRGFLKIGYHFVIRRNGVVEKGRSLDEPGAHCEGINSKSIGICMVGGLDSRGKPQDNFTSDQYLSLKALLTELKQKFPNASDILGHRDVPGVRKDCPCFDVKPWVAANLG